MCKFFSMCSDGNGNPIYFDWKIRKGILDGSIKGVESPDSHTSIASYFGHKGLKEDKLNKYEYNPLTKVFTIDQINTVDDKCLIEKWVRELDFKTIVPHLNLYPIKNPLDNKSKKVSMEELVLLKKWVDVRDSVRYSVRYSVGYSVGESVGDSVGDSVWESVWDSVGAECSKYVSCDKWEYIIHKKGVNPYQSCIDLYAKGLVPSFDGKLWRLHATAKARIVWEGSIEKLKEEIKKGI